LFSNKRSPPDEQAFLLKTSGRHQTNKHFYQKQTVATRRTNIFIKNRRAPPDEQALTTDEKQNTFRTANATCSMHIKLHYHKASKPQKSGELLLKFSALSSRMRFILRKQ